MSYITQKNLSGAEDANLCGFGGIDRSLSKVCDAGGNGADTDGSLYDIVNLRPMPDRSLRVRSGYRYCLDLGAAPRAVLSLTRYGVRTVYALVGNTVYSLNLDAGTKSEIGTVRTSTGDAEIFYFGSTLYLIDGYDIYRHSGSAFYSVDGYVPLYGNGWDSFTRGPVYEPKNLLTRRVRIRYLTSGINTELHFGMSFSSIDRVEINGAYIPLSSFPHTVSDSGTYITSSALPEDGEITVWLTLPSSSYMRAELTSCTRALPTGDTSSGRLICWGGDDPAEIFVSCPVTSARLAESRRGVPGSTGLYFPETSRVPVGEGRHAVRAVSRLREDPIIFTEGDTWLADWEGDISDPSRDMPAFLPVNSGIGCSVPDAVALCGNDPLTVCGKKIFRWHPSASLRDECSARIVSHPLGELTDGFDSAIVRTYHERGEVWFASSDDASGRVIIYDTSREIWFSYTGIYPDLFFEYGSEPGFIRGSEVFVMDASRTADLDSDGTFPITYAIHSNSLYFGKPWRKKRLGRVLLYASTGTGNATLTLKFSDGSAMSRSFSTDNPADDDRPGRTELRLPTGYFGSLRFSITGKSSPAARFCGIELDAVG